MAKPVAINRKQLLLSAGMLVGASAITLLMYLNRPSTDIAEPEYRPITVDVALAVKEELRIPIQAQGVVTPLQATSILAEVKGRIIAVSPAFNVGGFISKDELLLSIDPRDYETTLLRMQASVESAESNLAQERGRTEVALREWQKLPSNSQRSQDAKDLYLRKPQLELAEAQLMAANADLNTARDNLERTVIRAPYDALIRKKHTDLGQFVAAGTPLTDIFSVESAEIRLPIPQSKLAYLDLPSLEGYRAGTDVDLYTDVSGELKHWTAQLHRTEGVFDERSRVLYTVARIDDPYGLNSLAPQPLRIGTFVNAVIEGKLLPDLVVLPRYILRAGNHLWVVDEDLRLRNRKVTVLRAGADEMYITAGLDDGDMISLTTLDSSLSGAIVEVVSVTPSDQLYRTRDPKEKDEGGATMAGEVQ